MTPLLVSLLFDGGYSPYRLPGLAARFDASDLSSITFDGSNRVSQWRDKSGNLRHLAQATGSKQPLLQIGARNNLLFDGADDWMQAPAFTLNQPETVYWVGQQVSWTADDTLIEGNALNSFGLQQDGRASSPRLAPVAGSYGPITDAVTLGTDVVLAVVCNGASSRMQVNAAAATTGDVGAANMGGLIVGATASSLKSANMTVKEILVFAAAHDAATRTRVNAWLGSKWGIAQ